MIYLNKAPIWIKVILGLVGFLIIATVTAGILYVLLPNNKPSANNGTGNATQSTIISAQKLIDTYKSSGNIKDRNNYSLVSVNPTDTYIQYTDSNRPYDITITTTAYAEYQVTSADVTTNSSNMITTTESFLDELGFTKSTDQVTGTFTSKLFTNSTVVCQTDSRQSIDKQPVTYGVACVDKTVIDNQYKQLDTLAKLTNGTLAPTAVKSISTTNIIDGSRQLTILTTSNKDNTSTTYYFVTSDQNTWQYIGNRPTPSVDVQNSFQIPSSLRSSIDNSQYKDFLNTYIK